MTATSSDVSSVVPRTPVLVINLASAPDRMAYQTAQMNRLALNATRVEAVTRGEITLGQLASNSGRAVRPFAGSELACLLSHANCWEIVANASAPMLIVEDDAVLSDRLPRVLDDLAEAHDNRVINLETYSDCPKYLSRRPLNTFKSDLCTLHTVIRGSAGAAAYILGPETARRLLESLKIHAALADAFLGLHAGRRSLQTVPALAAQMATLETFYGCAFDGAAHSTIVAGICAEGQPARKRGLRRYFEDPKLAKRRLLLELQVAVEKLEGVLFGQKLTIQPCPTLLAH